MAEGASPSARRKRRRTGRRASALRSRNDIRTIIRAPLIRRGGSSALRVEPSRWRRRCGAADAAAPKPTEPLGSARRGSTQSRRGRQKRPDGSTDSASIAQRRRANRNSARSLRSAARCGMPGYHAVRASPPHSTAPLSEARALESRRRARSARRPRPARAHPDVARASPSTPTPAGSRASRRRHRRPRPAIRRAGAPAAWAPSLHPL